MNAIVVGTDGSAAAHATVLRAGALALQSGATLHLVAGYVPVRVSAEDRSQAPADIAFTLGPKGMLYDLLDEAEADLRRIGVKVRTWSSQETPSRLMRKVAREVGADVVICGPELGRVNDRPRRRRRTPRRPLAAQLGHQATWQVRQPLPV